MSVIPAVAATLLLLVDAVLLSPPPTLFGLIHPGIGGHLLQPLLVVAATLWQGRGRSREHGAVGLCVVLALLLCPMVALDQWAVPLAHAWRWAVTGSPDGWMAALPATVAAVLAATVLLVGPGRKPATEQDLVCRPANDNRPDHVCTPKGKPRHDWHFHASRAAGWTLVGSAAALPWLGVAAQALLYGFGAGPRMLVSALLQTAALAVGLWAVRTGRKWAQERGPFWTQGLPRNYLRSTEVGDALWPQGVGEHVDRRRAKRHVEGDGGPATQRTGMQRRPNAASCFVAGPQGWGQAALRVLPPLLLLAVYFVIKLETVSWSATDENIYFYDILLLTQGKLPYRDFFYAHPPLHVVLPGLLALLTDPTFLLLKLVPVAASMISGVFLYLAGARMSRLVGLLGAAFFLFAMEQLQASTNLTGINLTVMFVCGTFWAVVRGRPLIAGVLGGLGVLTGVYASVPVLALLPAAALGGLAPALRFGGGLVAAAGGGNTLCLLLFGDPFIEQVYRYHFLKEAKVEGFLAPGAWHLAGLAAAGLALTAAVVLAAKLTRVPGSLSARLRSRAVRGPAVCLGALLAGFAVATVAADGQGPIGLLWHDLERFTQDNEFLRFFFFHPHLVLAPAAAAVSFGAWDGVRRIRGRVPVERADGVGGTSGGMTSTDLRGVWVLPVAACCVALGALVELALLPESYTFYYVLLMPGLAVLLGCGAAWTFASAATLGEGAEAQSGERPAAATAMGTAVGWGGRLFGRWLGGRLAGLVIVAAALLAHFVWVPVGLAVGDHRFPHAPAGLTVAQRAELKPGTEVAGDLTCYDIKDNVATPFSSLIRERMLPRCRFQGSMEPGLLHYLWKKKWYFSRAGELADFIRLNSEEGETLTGSSLLAPLLAMLSGRTMAAWFVDTNSKRFKTGMVDGAFAAERCRQREGEERERCIRQESERRFWALVL
ncbi:MAG: glycosyltransferase family 39 protein, partial [Deltaproteobacteria bacterium]|nr:glycosyltransferase family 39 protein [Deltaproteobacteria bacterium]